MSKKNRDRAAQPGLETKLKAAHPLVAVPETPLQMPRLNFGRRSYNANGELVNEPDAS
jgi:hypothetical protein